MKTIIETERKCPECQSKNNQHKRGLNRSGTQRYGCGVCGKKYTPEPKRREYTEDERKQAIKMFYSGVSGRGVGKFYGMSKANVYNWIKKN